MAFTADQTNLIYEMLELFQGETFTWYDYRTWPATTSTSVPFGQEMDFSTATDALAAILTDIETNNATQNRETRIGEILTEYGRVEFSTVEIHSGGASGAPGVRYSAAHKRARLKKLLEIQLGFTTRKFGITQGEIPGANISGRSQTLMR